MPFLSPNDHQRRILQLSQEWNIVLPPAPGSLSRPQATPSFRTPNDDQVAEDLLQRRAVDAAQIRPKSGLTRAFSSNSLKKGKNWDPRDIIDVLYDWIANCGSPGVAEALIAKLAAAGVDLTGMQKQKSGILSRRKSLETFVDRTKLLRAAVERGLAEIVQVLLPHADPLALDTCLPVAIRRGNSPIVELLVRYGGNASQTAEGQDAFRQACAIQSQSHIVSLVLQSDGRPSPSWISQSMIDAARAACLDTVLHLSRSAADGNHNQAEALKKAVEMGRRDIAVAIIMGNNPPQRPGLDEAFGLLFEHPSLHPATKLDIAELLLCAGAQGDVLSQALERSCETAWYDMANLLASYGVSIEYNDAAVLKTAISRGQLDLVASLLNDKSLLNPSLASSCILLIPKQTTFEVRYSLLTHLLRKGANGTPLSECLVDAAEAGDVTSVDLLLKPFFPDVQSPNARAPKNPRGYERHEVASPDFRSGEALRTAVLRADTIMAQKILAGQPSPKTLTTVFPLTKNLAATDRYQMVELFLKGALSGPCLHGALQDAINEDASRRDEALIQLLLKHDADVNFNSGAGLHAVIVQKSMNLLATLMQNTSPQTAAARVPDVMQVTDDHRARYDMMSMLLRAGAAIGMQEVAQALLQTLKEKPVDMSLLRLLLQLGAADINAMDGAILQKATHNPDPKIIELILSHGKILDDTISRSLGEVAPLPSTEGKTWKLKAILSRSSRKEDLSNVLVQEVQSLLRNNTRQPTISTLKLLLESGADPNAYKASALCHAVVAANIPISDLLFECQSPPSPMSLGFALPHALHISDLMDRLSFTKRLVEAGAYPEEVNRALTYSISTYPDDIALLGVLASKADMSDGEALSLSVSKESPDTLSLLLKNSQPSLEIRNSTLEKALETNNRGVRHALCKQLLFAGVSTIAASNALLIAARDGDLELGDMLMAHGASISSNNGQAIIEACRGGSVEVVKVLLKTDKDTKKTTLEQGFQAATEVRDLNKRAVIFEQLLRKGVTGEVVDAQLQSAARSGEGGEGVLKVLLAAGADPNYDNGEAVCAATRSAFIGNLELLLGLWGNGGSQKKPSQPTLVRALKASWKLNRDTRLQIVDDLMRAGLPVTEDLHMALNKAVNEEDPEERLVKRLLQHGASPLINDCKTLVDATRNMASASLELLLGSEIPQDDINRAFSQGFESSNFEAWFTESGLETARMLLEKGSKGDALSGALVLVMKTHTVEAVDLANRFVDLLVAHGPDVNYNNGEPLQHAASKANVLWTRQLLSLDPTVETLSFGFQRIFDTALTQEEALDLFTLFSEHQNGEVRIDVMAAQPGLESVLVRAISQYPRSTTILATLLDAGYYYDQATTFALFPDVEEEEVTLLAWAIAQPQKRVSSTLIQMLLDRGAKVNVETKLSRTTPLMLAVQARRPDVVKSLLLDGAEVDVLDFMGRTPLSLATQLGGELAIQMMGSLLAAEPPRDDGSLHNAARELNLPAVKVLLQAGHDPDFPSPTHGGRSALGEACLHASGAGELTAERERTMQKVMACLVDAGSDLSIKSNGKSILYLCFDAFDPILTTRALLKVGMWKYITKPFNHYTDGTYTFSPTTYVSRVLPSADTHEALLTLLRANRAIDIFFANSGPQPEGATGLPEDIEVRERARKARLEQLTEEQEDFALLLARKRETASVESQIWNQKAQMDEARRQRLHAEDLASVRSRAQLEESLATSSTQRRISEQRAIGDAALARTRALAASEQDLESGRQRRALEWEGKLNTERVDNARALSALRVSEREEVDRLDRVAEDRLGRRLEAQRKLVEGQERLAKRIAEGPGGDPRRQIGYVTEMN